VKQSEEARLKKRLKMGYAAPPDAKDYQEWKFLSSFEKMVDFVEYMFSKLLADWYATTRIEASQNIRDFEKKEMLERRRKIESVLDSMPGLYLMLRGDLSYSAKNALEGIADNIANRDYTDGYKQHYDLCEAHWTFEGKAVDDKAKDKHTRNIKHLLDFALKKYPNPNRAKNNYQVSNIRTAQDAMSSI